MARPSDRKTETGRVLALAFVPVVMVARAASELDRLALDRLQAAAEACERWSKDTTEASRRDAAANVAAALALVSLPASIAPAPNPRARRALATFGAALSRFLDGDLPGATMAADAASRMASRA